MAWEQTTRWSPPTCRTLPGDTRGPCRGGGGQPFTGRTRLSSEPTPGSFSLFFVRCELQEKLARGKESHILPEHQCPALPWQQGQCQRSRQLLLPEQHLQLPVPSPGRTLPLPPTADEPPPLGRSIWASFGHPGKRGPGSTLQGNMGGRASNKSWGENGSEQACWGRGITL